MATAVTPSVESKAPNAGLQLLIASAIGAAFVLAGIVVAAYVVPMLWAGSTTMGTPIFRLVSQFVAAGAIIAVGAVLAGANPPRGYRGGVFLVTAAVITLFFVVRAVGTNTEGTDYGLPVTLVTLGVLVGAAFKLLTSPRAERWMLALEEQGWFHLYNYKKTQGLKLRRYTLLGLLIIFGSGVYTYAISSRSIVGSGDWSLSIPFWGKSFVFLTEVQYAVPVILAVLTAWFAWRVVNVPNFADFLIATEAEMNKVSWSTRKRLTQDTIVVLVTVALLTMFLLVVDLFWGWLLSRELVGVLPPKSKTPAGVVADPLAGKDIDW